MVGKKVLIGYGTRYGATEEVVNRIAEIIHQDGNQVQVENLKKNKNPPSPQEFDGVIIASGIRCSEWTKESKNYINKYKKQLRDQEKIFGLFVCSILAVTNYKEAVNSFLRQNLVKVGIPDDNNRIIYDAFGGVMDFTKTSKIGIFDKKGLQLWAKELNNETEGPFKYEEEGKNDFRDWEKISEYAENFNKMLNKK